MPSAPRGYGDRPPAPHDRLPPQNIEAEQGVLGGILLDNEVLYDIIPLLKVEDFYRDSHQIFYRSIRELYDQGKPVDAILLAEDLDRREELHHVGGIEAIAELIQRVPHAANSKFHAQIVREKAIARAAIEAANQILSVGYANTQTSDQLVELAQRLAGSLPTFEAEDDHEQVDLVSFRDIPREQVRWVWPNRIPRGKLSMYAGDAGIGKSWLTCALAATVSRNAVFPDGLHPEDRSPGHVIILNAEDGAGDTLGPRLEAAGADLSLCHTIRGVSARSGRTRGFSLQRDCERLARKMKRVGDVRLITIDPISCYLGGHDEHKNAEVREAIQPLKELAEKTDAAIVLIHHLNKGGGTGKAIYRMAGSMAFAAACRVANLVIRDPENPARRLILTVKNNLAPEPLGLAYRVTGDRFEWEAEPVRMTAEEALGKERDAAAGKKDGGRMGRPPAKVQAAVAWLVPYLRVGPARLGRLIEDAGKADIKRGTLYNAIDIVGDQYEADNRKWVRLATEVPLADPDADDPAEDDVPAF